MMTDGTPMDLTPEEQARVEARHAGQGDDTPKDRASQPAPVIHKRRWFYPGGGLPGYPGRLCDQRRVTLSRASYLWQRVTCPHCLHPRAEDKECLT